MGTRIKLFSLFILFSVLLVSGSLANAETWKVSFNGYPGTMELNRSGNVYTGRFNLHGNWEEMLDLRVFRNAIFFRRASADQKYLGVMEDGRMLGVFSQAGAGSYPWSAERNAVAPSTPVASFPEKPQEPLPGNGGLPPAVGNGVGVTVYWHMADDADVYLNGRPLRDYSPSFKTRPDEAPKPPFSARAVLKDGDLFTVGGRRGGSFGLMLIAVDDNGRIVFKTDRESWKIGRAHV